MSNAPISDSRQTIVLVDDDPAVRRAFRRALGRRFCNVEAFSSGLEALRRISQGGLPSS
jgi:CheY-like chemotaxis protein